MKTKNFNVNRKDCNDLAHRIFMEISGIDRQGRKFEKMQEDAFRMRKLIEERIKIRVAYSFYEQAELTDRTAVIEGTELSCTAFQQVEPEAVEGVYIYALSVGDFGLPEDPIMDQLYADLWGTAFTDAARLLLKAELEKEVKLSDSFGPGLYGMDITEMEKLAQLISFEDLNIELRNSSVILPLKSCAGLYFKVNEHYTKISQECQNCRGTRTSCKLCQIPKGVY